MNNEHDDLVRIRELMESGEAIVMLLREEVKKVNIHDSHKGHLHQTLQYFVKKQLEK